MLRRLSIRDIVLIDALDLEFGSGLGAMTGETGAGKSILLDALGLALGNRGSADLVRAGAERGTVIAEFEIVDGHPVEDLLAEHEIEAEDGRVILRRTVTAEGRGRGFVNDQAASAGLMRSIGAMLVEIHGQFDDRGLMNPKAHLGLLDLYAGLGAKVAALSVLHRTWRDAEKALAAAHTAAEEAERDAEYIRHSVEELEALAPEQGEEDVLDAERRRMCGAVSVSEDVTKAAQALGPHGAEGAVADAMRRLDVAAGKADGALDPSLAALERAMTELGEAVAAVDAAVEALAVNPHELEQVEERLFALRALARKHRLGVDDLWKLRAEMGDKLAFIEGGAERIAALEIASEQARAALVDAARGVSEARQAAAQRLDAEVAGELAPLKLDRAKFRTLVAVDEAAPGAEGIDAVSFEVATNPGSKPGPIDKVASGGELSRFLLALKVCLARGEEGKTLIFDEIDRGVGGATAAAIGARLARLGRAGQVLVITHAPQVGAQADHHWKIQKSVSTENGVEITRTSLTPLDSDARIDELARMLAGETITTEARAAAKALMSPSA